VHYLYEPGSFVPVAQALRKSPIRLHKQPDWRQREYDFDQDPLWHTEVKPQAFEAIAWYHCDHLGTPMELTDEQGNIAWAVQYKAWGEVREECSAWAKQHGLGNPIRFQGQYHDHETGLHYNRYRYYDPHLGRFVNQDIIQYSGGINLYVYSPNPIGWCDPLGLAKRSEHKVTGNTAGGDVMNRGVHVNIQGPGLPKKGHIGLVPDTSGERIEFVPVDPATRNMKPGEWKKACECIVEYLDEPSNVKKMASAAQAGIDANPKSNRVEELAKTRDIFNKHHSSKTNPAR
jgi:RHS repeat-associated protein